MEQEWLQVRFAVLFENLRGTSSWNPSRVVGRKGKLGTTNFLRRILQKEITSLLVGRRGDPTGERHD